MCATPAPNELCETDPEMSLKKDVIAPARPWKRWRAPVYKTNESKAELDPLNGKQTMTRCPDGKDEGRKPIYGIGRNYNTQLGQTAFRTGASIKLDTNLQTSLDIIQRNIEEAARDPRSTVRLMVQGDEFWYSDASAAELIDMMVMVGDAETARTERLNCSFDEAVPVGVCVVEEITPSAGEGNTGGCAQATWLFRHDVIDGWRALRYLCRCVLGTADLTLDRLYQRHADSALKSAGSWSKCCQTMGAALAPVCYAPAALRRVLQVASVDNSGERRKFYAHVICDLEKLKDLGQRRGTGSLTSTLTASILEAYFAADPEKKVANVASNVLFDPTSPDGNHMCLKVACVQRKGSTMKKTAAMLQSTSQKVADLWVASLSRKYALGQLPQHVNDFVEKQQKGLDFLVSSLPAYDRTTPTVLDLKVSREFTEWNPSIVYALGIGDNLFLDFYWEVPASFNDERFCSTIAELLECTEIHNNLPAAY